MTATDIHAGHAVVLFDGQCAFCRKSVGILQKLDWLGTLRFQSGREVDKLPPSDVPLDPQKLIDEMHVVTPDRRNAYAGFSAFRWMAWRLPPTMLLAPLLYVPGVPWLGDRVYKWVARNRFNLVPCKDGECKVTLRK